MNEPHNDDADKGADELKMPNVSPEEALAAFMEVDPEKVRKAEKQAGSKSNNESQSTNGS